MMVISSYMPFPAISWWAQVADAQILLLDAAEHYEKMTLRNKYRIAGANNPIQLSIPLNGGRDQRTTMDNITIHNQQRWQVQHWRTLTSVYRQSPYWEYYEPELEHLFSTPFDKLADFDLATLQWCMKQLKITPELKKNTVYQKQYPPEIKDIRGYKGFKKETADKFPAYYQLFEERTGFLPDLSIIDLIMAEGPHTASWIKDNQHILVHL